MAYRLSVSTDVPAALRATAAEQLEDAAQRLDEEEAADPVEAVHEARKDLKKTRSLLRLARPGVQKKAYRARNDELREIARSLSDTRDADVMVETVDKLSDRFAGRLPATAFAELSGRFTEEAARGRAGVVGDVLAPAAARLHAVRRELDGWPLEGCDEKTLARGARREYGRGRDALALAEKHPSVEHLHEWRKRVKDLWYHARLLEETWPAVLKAQADQAHELSDLLGDDHDLAVLRDRLTQGEGLAAEAPVDDDAIVELIDDRRGELEAEAFRLGHRLYAEKPKAYAQRLGAYLAAARAERQAAATV